MSTLNVIDALRENQILNSYGQITNVDVFQTVVERTASLNKIKLKHGAKGGVIGVVKIVLKNRKSISESDIAKCEPIDLEKQFREFRAGRKQFH